MTSNESMPCAAVHEVTDDTQTCEGHAKFAEQMHSGLTIAMYHIRS